MGLMSALLILIQLIFRKALNSDHIIFRPIVSALHIRQTHKTGINAL